MADEGKLQKMEVDYSSTVDEKIPQCEQLARVNDKLTLDCIFFDNRVF